MHMVIFAVFDEKLGCFGAAQGIATIGAAIRGFEDACRGADSPFGAHPEDYSLFEVGSFDQDTGLVTGMSQPHVLARAADFVKKGG